MLLCLFVLLCLYVLPGEAPCYPAVLCSETLLLGYVTLLLGYVSLTPFPANPPPSTLDLWHQVCETDALKLEVEQRVSLGKVYYNLTAQEKLICNKRVVEEMPKDMVVVLRTVKTLVAEDARKYGSRFSSTTGGSGGKVVVEGEGEDGGEGGGEVAAAAAKGKEVKAALKGRKTMDLNMVHQRILAGYYASAWDAREELRKLFEGCVCKPL